MNISFNEFVTFVLASQETQPKKVQDIINNRSKSSFDTYRILRSRIIDFTRSNDTIKKRELMSVMNQALLDSSSKPGDRNLIRSCIEGIKKWISHFEYKTIQPINTDQTIIESIEIKAIADIGLIIDGKCHYIKFYFNQPEGSRRADRFRISLEVMRHAIDDKEIIPAILDVRNSKLIVYDENQKNRHYKLILREQAKMLQNYFDEFSK